MSKQYVLLFYRIRYRSRHFRSTQRSYTAIRHNGAALCSMQTTSMEPLIVPAPDPQLTMQSASLYRPLSHRTAELLFSPFYAASCGCIPSTTLLPHSSLQPSASATLTFKGTAEAESVSSLRKLRNASPFLEKIDLNSAFGPDGPVGLSLIQELADFAHLQDVQIYQCSGPEVIGLSRSNRTSAA